MATTRALRITLRPNYLRTAQRFAVALPVALMASTSALGLAFDSVPMLVLSGLSVIASGLYWAGSIYFIQTEEMAGITTLEHPSKEVLEGWRFAPAILTQVQRFPRGKHQSQFPGEPEQISKLPDKEADRMRSTLLRPLRITTGPKDPKASADDILNAQYTLTFTFTVMWQVQFDFDKMDTDEGLFEFMINIPGETWAQKYANILKMLRDTTQQTLEITLVKYSASQAIVKKGEIIKKVKKKLIEAVADWGISICELNVLGFELSHDMNTRLDEIPQANARKVVTMTDADGEKYRLTKEGEGRRDARIAEAKARQQELAAEGKGLAEAAESLTIDPDTYYAGHVAKETFGEGDVLVAPSLGDAVAGAYLGNALKKNKGDV